MPTLSVVIPAHNESGRIGPCLARLLGGASDGEFEVVVVCNGCDDDTAEEARAHPGITVVEIPQSSKIDALNEGDRAVSAYPRLYLDADIGLDTDSARLLARNVNDAVVAAAPALEVDTTGSPWSVRSYLRIWERLPSTRRGLAGRGAFVLSATGRARFDRFPDVIADDFYIDRLYASDERRILEEVTSRVRAPRSLEDLVARKTRVFTGNRQLGGPNTGNRTAWIGVVARDPRRVIDVPAYVYVSLVARRRASRRLARQDFTWDGDNDGERRDRVVDDV